MQEEYSYMTKDLQLDIVGFCGDASGDERSARTKMRIIHPYLLFGECWAHQVSCLTIYCIHISSLYSSSQIQLIVGDYISANPDTADAIDAALLVIKWFTHHSYALGILNQEQLTLATIALAFIVPIITRWTAHYCSVARLLQLQKAVHVTVIKHEEKLIESVGTKKDLRTKAVKIMDTVKDKEFWDRLQV